MTHGNVMYDRARRAEDTMPIPRVGPLAGVTVAPVVTSILLAGCGTSARPAPNVDQVAHTMQNQVYKLLEATWTADPRITDPLFDAYVPCGNGKVMVTYAVTGKRTVFAARPVVSGGAARARPATPSQIIDDLVRFLPEVGTFSVVGRTDHGATVQVVNTSTRIRLTLHSPGPDRLTISGQTDCLKPGNLGRDVG
jgi:hypothetical protein